MVLGDAVKAHVRLKGVGPTQPNRTSNYVLTRLTLTRNGGSCDQASNRAFLRPR